MHFWKKTLRRKDAHVWKIMGTSVSLKKHVREDQNLNSPVPDFVYSHVLNILSYRHNLSLNTAIVSQLAQPAPSVGINTVCVSGSMGQFDTMTVDECNSLVKALIDANDKYDLNFHIYQIGSTVLSDSFKMTYYVNEIGASAIA